MQVHLSDLEEVLRFYVKNPAQIRNTFNENFVPDDVINFLNKNRPEGALTFQEYIEQIESYGTDINFVFALLMGIMAERMLSQQSNKA